jgi:lysophospholipase L1-like esterase
MRNLGVISSFSKQFLLAASIAVTIAACADSPTGPSAVPPAGQVSEFGQEPPPIPPRNANALPVALGVTRFVAFGDSLTFGTLSTFDGLFVFDVPSHSYPVRLELGLDVHHAPQNFVVGNFGNPGETVTASATFTRYQNMLGSVRPQAVLLLEGVNDLNGGISQPAISSALGQMLDYATLRGMAVLIATMPRIYDTSTRDRPDERIVPFNDEVRRLASARRNVHVVDLYTAFGTDRSLMGGDGLHPTPEGYEVMASTFLDAIELAFPVTRTVQ